MRRKSALNRFSMAVKKDSALPTIQEGNEEADDSGLHKWVLTTRAIENIVDTIMRLRDAGPRKDYCPVPPQEDSNEDVEE